MLSNLDYQISNIEKAMALCNSVSGMKILADGTLGLFEDGIHYHMNDKTYPFNDSFDTALLSAMTTEQIEDARVEMSFWLQECLQIAKDSLILNSSDVEKLINGKNNPFSDILLNTKQHKLLKEKMTESGWYDKSITDFEVKIMFNGVSVSVRDFNEVMEDWWNRLDVVNKESLGLLELDCAVQERAEKLVKEKLSLLSDMVGNLECNFELEQLQ